MPEHATSLDGALRPARRWSNGLEVTLDLLLTSRLRFSGRARSRAVPLRVSAERRHPRLGSTRQ
jgi:hypothetical protein